MIADFDEINFDKPVILQKNNLKYWEISIQDLNTIMKCGNLENGKKVEIKNAESIHTHKSLYELYIYLQKQIDIKMAKGYRLHEPNKIEYEDLNQKDSDSDEKSKEPPIKKKVHSDKNQYQIKIQSPTNEKSKKEDVEENKEEEKSGKKKKQSKKSTEKGKDDQNLQITKKDSKKYLKLKKTDYSDTSQKTSLTDLTDLSLATKSQKSDNQDNNDNDFDDFKMQTYKLGPGTSKPQPCLLAFKYEKGNLDPKGWFISEKLDGVRGIWTGKAMFSRNKKKFYLPEFFTKDWPVSQLDGELWIRRNSFQECVSIVKRHEPQEDRWKNITYMVYDAPGLKLPFKERIKLLQEELPKCNNPHIKLHQHILCDGVEHLQEQLDKVVAKDGEGVMLRDPESFYERKRSNTLLKVKTFQDEECTVVGYQKGEGRCLGMIGALLVENKERGEFKIGSGLDDQLRKNPPKIGAIVTFKYWGLTVDGKPRFPIFLREYVKE